MDESCKFREQKVIIQENGIIRNKSGYIIGRLSDDIDFYDEHIEENNKEPE